MTSLDIVMPVYQEGPAIIPVLESLRRSVTTPFRLLICYDRDDDTTLTALRAYPHPSYEVVLVKNRGVGPHAAVMAGLAASTAPCVAVFPADDACNANIMDAMVQQYAEGCDIVCASRLMPGGRMEGSPWLKDRLVRAAGWTLRVFARVPTHDASNGFRLFSRRVVEMIPIESRRGFTYSIELLVKCHRLRWTIGEVPAVWFQRTTGASRFRLLRWLPAYLRWYVYAFATTYLRRPASSVPLRHAASPRAGLAREPVEAAR